MKTGCSKWFLILALMLPSHSFAALVQSGAGEITAMRTSSEYHASVPAGSSETIFRLSSGHAGCDWLGVNNKDKTFVSMLLSAQSQSKTITVWYYNDRFSPIWGTVCQAAIIEAK